MSEQPTEPVLPQHGLEGGEAAELVLREERAHVHAQRRVAERVHVRRRVVSERVTVEVELRREELVIEREPIEESALGAGPLPGPEALTDGEPLVIVLHAERPVVETEVVPVERITLHKHEIVSQEQVTTEVGREVAEVDGRPID